MHSPSSSFPPSPSFLPVPNVENVATFGGERTRNEREVPKDLSNVSDRPLLEPSFTLVKRPSFITMKENVIIEGRPSKMILDCRSGRISLYPMEADEVDYLLDSLEVPVELDPSPKTPTPVTPMKPDALDSEVTEAKLREFERISSHLRRTPSTPTPLSRVLPATYGTPMPIRQMHVPVEVLPPPTLLLPLHPKSMDAPHNIQDVFASKPLDMSLSTMYDAAVPLSKKARPVLVLKPICDPVPRPSATPRPPAKMRRKSALPVRRNAVKPVGTRKPVEIVKRKRMVKGGSCMH